MRTPRLRWQGLVGAALVLGVIVGPAVTASGKAGEAVAVLAEVRIARHDTFDRVVFEFTGSVVPKQRSTDQGKRPWRRHGGPERFPDRRRRRPGADDRHVACRRHLRRVNPPPPLYSGPTSFTPTDTAGNVVQVVETGDFESVLSWAIGLRSAATPTVSVVTGPTRVVLDIPHTATPAQPATGGPTFTG